MDRAIRLPGLLRMCACALLLGLVLAGAAGAAELVGRVVDAVAATVHTGAEVRLRAGPALLPPARTDAQGFFRIADLAPGPYLVDVRLPDGRSFVARLVLWPGRARQFLELDFARAVPPDDDEDY